MNGIDGSTLLMGTASTHGTNPAVQKSLLYDAIRDFAPVALVGRTLVRDRNLRFVP